MRAASRTKRDAFFAKIADSPQLMGIVNVTPDSFSDGGSFLAPRKAIGEAERHVAGGASIIDIGAESTRPGHSPVSIEEERGRLEPVISLVVDAVDVAISIDTTKASIAEIAIGCGAAVINDQWGLQGDPGMAPVAAKTDAGLVLMHNRPAIDPELDIVDDMRRFFDRSLAIADDAGITRDRLILDPGIGFGKSKAQNVRALGDGVETLAASYRLPILVGVSRKSLFAVLIGATKVEERLVGTLAANLAACARGARVFRVHDCAPHRDAFTIARAIGFE